MASSGCRASSRIARARTGRRGEREHEALCERGAGARQGEPREHRQEHPVPGSRGDTDRDLLIVRVVGPLQRPELERHGRDEPLHDEREQRMWADRDEEQHVRDEERHHARPAHHDLPVPKQQGGLAEARVSLSIAEVLEHDAGDEQHVERACEDHVTPRRARARNHHPERVGHQHVGDGEDERCQIGPVGEADRPDRIRIADPDRDERDREPPSSIAAAARRATMLPKACTIHSARSSASPRPTACRDREDD